MTRQEMPQYLIPEELAGTHARLVNWARWPRPNGYTCSPRRSATT